MCGRYARFSPAEIYARLFEAEGDPPVSVSYNVAPSQLVLAARADDRGRRELVALHWGLVPFWARDPDIGYRTINARAETVAQKPAFRNAFRARRCLVAADGFYEWKAIGRRKQPYFFRLAGGAPFGLAGLWERWSDGDRVIESCTVIVTDANARVAPVHDRMPVILAPNDFAVWLDPAWRDRAALQRLLRPYPAEAMEAWPVGAPVNDPRHDGPQLVERIEVDPAS